MKYIVSWTLPIATFHAAVGRFLETGGMPPAGVKLVGRWHGMSGRGFAVVETTDANALYTWVAEWSDLLALETTPALKTRKQARCWDRLRVASNRPPVITVRRERRLHKASQPRLPLDVRNRLERSGCNVQPKAVLLPARAGRTDFLVLFKISK
jgi:hypothetical protein